MARALVVDDDADLRELLSAVMVRDGHEVMAVADGREALEQLRAGRFDVLILDVEIPEMSGLVFLEASAVMAHPRPPVIILSGRTSQQDRDRGLDAGATFYLAKPFRRHEFMAAVEHVLADPGATDGQRGHLDDSGE